MSLLTLLTGFLLTGPSMIAAISRALILISSSLVILSLRDGDTPAQAGRFARPLQYTPPPGGILKEAKA
jgi:hypothetical protein